MSKDDRPGCRRKETQRRADTQIIHQDIKRGEERCINKDAALCNQINNKLLGLGSIASVHNLGCINKAGKKKKGRGATADASANVAV